MEKFIYIQRINLTLRLVITLIICTVIMLPVVGQEQEEGEINQNNYDVDMFPKTADAAALSKFVDIPGGNYTGVAEFSIPLYTIETDGIAIPIVLKYSTTGIKVSELATRTGLGWVLDAGPSLSQQIMGNRDLTITKPIWPEIDTDIPMSPTVGMNEDEDPYYIAARAVDYTNEMMNSGTPVRDLKPDIFSYSLLGASGKFILDASGQFGIPMPYNQVKIKFNDYSSAELTDEEGIAYLFSTETNPDTGAKTYNNCNTSVSADGQYADPDFKIRTIETIKGGQIKYYYEQPTNSKYINSVSENKLLEKIIYGASSNNDKPIPPRCYNYTVSKETTLTRIEFRGGEVQFQYGTDRQDIPGDVYLKRVLVKDNKGDVVKDLSLLYDSYFESAAPDYGFTYPIDNEFLNGVNKRLKLTQVKDNKTQGSYYLNYYENYNNKTLPHRISFNQDYWGVFNGKNNDSSVKTGIPTSKYNKISFPGRTFVFFGADKQPDINYGKLGSLKRIQYPSGGYTQIEYEADEYLSSSNNPILGYQQVVSRAEAGTLVVEFDLPAGALEPTLNVGTNNPYNYQHLGDYCSFKLSKSGNTIIEGNASIDNQYRDNDSGGHYKLELTLGNESGNENCFAEYKWVNELVLDNSDTRKAGTIRVSKIESNDNNSGKITRTYTYKYPQSYPQAPGLANKTSGVNLGDELFKSKSVQQNPVGVNGAWLKKVVLTNNPGWQIASVRGKAIAYDYVGENYENSSNSEFYRKEYRFKNDTDDAWAQYNPEKPINFTWPVDGLDRGMLLEEKLYDSQNNLLKETKYEYDYDTHFNSEATAHPDGSTIIGYGLEIKLKSILQNAFEYDYEAFPIKNYWIKNTLTTTKEYFGNKLIETKKYSNYSPSYKHTFPVETYLTDSQGDKISNVYKYPQDLTSAYSQSEIMGKLVNKNRISQAVISKTYNNSTPTSESRTLYKEYTFSNPQKKLILPEFIYARKGEIGNQNMNPEQRDLKITYDKYDRDGNLIQYTLGDNPDYGSVVSIVWGYNGQYPIAKVEGLAYSEFTSKANALISLSNANNLTPTSFEPLRKMEGAVVTAYIYDPLVGLSMVIQPNGQFERYEYDQAGRLEKITDQDDKTLKKVEYHYQTQP